ncbi:unnamed protein product [Cladocopium goreaui]|uniref:Aminoglycoside phosphotransferase domain-containing protein n=1 Tax=Cladocopium goreaui TaxID=2562237 RepID=A0A9P1FZ22_9DINO|nr:unnamed protein product [Cladocopium goreaui]
MQGVNSPPKRSAQLRSDRDVQNLVKYNLFDYKHLCRDLLQRVIEHDPADSHAFHNLGTLLSADEVIQVQLQGGSREFTQKDLFLESIRLDNGYALAYYNLGFLLSADEVIQVQLQGGSREFTKKGLYLDSIRLDNGHTRAYFNLGTLLSADEVIQVLDNGCALAYFNLGTLLSADEVIQVELQGGFREFTKQVGETAKAVMPDEITEPRFLQDWKQEILEVAEYANELGCFLSGGGSESPQDYVGLTHNNLQIDNAFFWRNEQNEVEVGLLDWGILGCGPLSGAMQGCISGASTEVLLEHRDVFLRAFIDSYAENGGPRLDLERFKTMSNLQMLMWSMNITSNVSQVLKFTRPTEWAEIKDWMDPRLLDRFQTRAHTTQFKEALQLYKKWNLYGVFQKWRQENGLPKKG